MVSCDKCAVAIERERAAYQRFDLIDRCSNGNKRLVLIALVCCLVNLVVIDVDDPVRLEEGFCVIPLHLHQFSCLDGGAIH